MGRAWWVAALWVLSGCGWGVTLGSCLEAVRGSGPGVFLAPSGEVALKAAGGALLGMTVFPFLAFAFFAPMIAPFWALLGRLERRFGKSQPASADLFPQISARGALLLSIFVSLFLGAAFGGAFCAGWAMKIGETPWARVEWPAVIGCLVGALLGADAFLDTVFLALPPRWQTQVLVVLPGIRGKHT